MLGIHASCLVLFTGFIQGLEAFEVFEHSSGCLLKEFVGGNVVVNCDALRRGMGVLKQTQQSVNLASWDLSTFAQLITI